MALSTYACTITPTGISAPTYDEILADLKEKFRAIYGQDIYIEPDSQDGQWLAILAKGYNDQNNMAKAVYNAFSPTFAQGVGLSSVVKINGITRQVSSFSTAVGTVVGVAGSVITGGVVADQNNNLWDLPPVVTIPLDGDIDVTVTAQQPGAIVAPVNSITRINNPQLGWQSFTNTNEAVPGAPVESDATLRRRQTTAASIPSQSPLAGVQAALAQLDGVTRVRCYENPSGAPDANGLPAHSISAVVEGGTLSDIAETIGQKKTPGAATYGTTTEPYTDPITGILYNISFFVLADSTMTLVFNITRGAGWITTYEDQIKQAVCDYINSLGIGDDVQFSRLWAPAYLNGQAGGLTYEITSFTLNGGSVDVPVDFNKAAVCTPADITLNLT